MGLSCRTCSSVATCARSLAVTCASHSAAASASTSKLLDRNELARPRLAISLLREDAQLYGAIRLAMDKVESTLFSS